MKMAKPEGKSFLVKTADGKFFIRTADGKFIPKDIYDRKMAVKPPPTVTPEIQVTTVPPTESSPAPPSVAPVVDKIEVPTVPPTEACYKSEVIIEPHFESLLDSTATLHLIIAFLLLCVAGLGIVNWYVINKKSKKLPAIEKSAGVETIGKLDLLSEDMRGLKDGIDRMQSSLHVMMTHFMDAAETHSPMPKASPAIVKPNINNLSPQAAEKDPVMKFLWDEVNSEFKDKSTKPTDPRQVLGIIDKTKLSNLNPDPQVLKVGVGGMR